MVCYRLKFTYFTFYVVSNLKELRSVVLDVVAGQIERDTAQLTRATCSL